MNDRLRRAACGVTLWMLVAGLEGCGDSGLPRVAVSGTVTLDGESLPQGRIVFIPTDGTVGPKAGGEIVDGQFAIKRENGPMIGKLRVEIIDEPDLGIELDDPEAFNTRVTSSRGRLPKSRIPPRYNANSTLVEETNAAGPNQFAFELKTK